MRDTQKIDLIWTDVETTGLDPKIDDICEIGWVRTSYDCAKEISSGSCLIHPDDVNLVRGESSGAFKINGYPSRLSTTLTVDRHKAIQEWCDAAKGARLAGANVSKFDFPFLSIDVEGYTESSLDKLLGDYHCLDINSVAAPLLISGEIPNLSSNSTLTLWAGFPKEPLPHVALYGAYQALEVYRKLLIRYGIINEISV